MEGLELVIDGFRREDGKEIAGERGSCARCEQSLKKSIREREMRGYKEQSRGSGMQWWRHFAVVMACFSQRTGKSSKRSK